MVTALRNAPAISRGIFLGFLYAIAAFGCASASQQPAAPPDTRAADDTTIRKADADWAAVAQAKQVEGWVSYYSDDAVVLPPNESTATGKDAIRKAVSELLTLPGLTIKWEPAKIEVACSGDIAYDHGTYELTFKDSRGKTISDQGKYVEVWKKQSDGGWKCVVDTWNSDLPAAPPSANKP
jgi:ketosteroid isomerase-like protein